MENRFKKYYSRLAFEGLIKALIFGCIVGLSLSFISAFITFFMVYEQGAWIAIVALVVGALISTPIFYFAKFRPTTKSVAERIDRLGLEERLITMLQFEKDDSYIAMRQREDAKVKLNSVHSGQIRITLFKLPIIMLAVALVFSVTMITLSTLSARGLIGFELSWEGLASAEEIIVFYDVDGGGEIAGEAEQVVRLGESTVTIEAVPKEGWMFEKWTDNESDNPIRSDIAIEDWLAIEGGPVFIAKFIEGEPQKPGGGGGDGEEEPEPDDGTGDPPEPTPEPPPPIDIDWDMIIDNQTPYMEILEPMLEAGYFDEKILSGELTPAQVKFLLLYLKGIS